MERFTYRGKTTKEISFPLGGIGTGCIGLSGNGSLIDWEIFNRPNKGSRNGFTHFAIKAEANGELLDARVLNGDYAPPYSGEMGGGPFHSFGFGTHRTTLAGVPHFRDVTFVGEFPFATVSFGEEAFPGRVELTAFNPFIPLNDRDSSIPGAFFEIAVTNTSCQAIDYTIALSVNNPLPKGSTVNRYQSSQDRHGLSFTSTKFARDQVEYGDLAVITPHDDVSYQEYWYRGSWFDNLGIFWREFTTPGRLRNRSYADPGDHSLSSQDPGADVGTLAAHLQVAPGEVGCVRFVLTWNYPNCYNYWNPGSSEGCDEGGSGSCGCSNDPQTWQNFYATMFPNSLASAHYSLDHWDRLYEDTRLFQEALYASTIPEVALEAVAANLSILKTPTCLRLEDGSFYGWEGCHCQSGCCEGSCTHVWNYAYALPFLFPKLERSMRDLDFRYNQDDNGGMTFRLQLPIGRERSAFRPCVDGQLGGVVKTYRDWLLSGDTQWLRQNWPAVKKCIEYAWSDKNSDRWDHNRDGVVEGRQHHTLDMELFGPNAWLTGFYLAGLKAAAAMAAHLGEESLSQEYLSLFARGKQWVDEHLFNGSYYYHLLDLTDKSLVEQFEGGRSLTDQSVLDAYWNEEAGEIKYQIGEGCGIDQVVAQWHANICGLGEIFDPAQTRTALQSIYQHNFKPSMRDHFNPCRLYSLNDEAGIVICEWPQGTHKPVVPIPYAEETMNGFEYQVAIHMIQEGMVDEGMRIVTAIRHRYDGEKRNPWNEFECGSNYARSMASYALLTAFSGFTFNMVEKRLGFAPVAMDGSTFQCFWSIGSGWGTVQVREETITLRVLYGEIELNAVNLASIEGRVVQRVTLADASVPFSQNGTDLRLDGLAVSQGQAVTITMS